MQTDGLVAWMDVWNARTFDRGLLEFLESHRALELDYWTADQRIERAHEALGSSGTPALRASNRLAPALLSFKEQLERQLAVRSIRGWHYTRLADDEVERERPCGIELSTLTTLQSRLDARIAAGELSIEVAAALYAISPFHSQRTSREDQFWMTSKPIPVTDSGVRPLLFHWGGEVASMWVNDNSILEQLSMLGLPRVLEIAVPLSLTQDESKAADAVAATFAYTLRCRAVGRGFDLCLRSPLASRALLRVHTKGEDSFSRLGHDP